MRISDFKPSSIAPNAGIGSLDESTSYPIPRNFKNSGSAFNLFEAPKNQRISPSKRGRWWLGEPRGYKPNKEYQGGIDKIKSFISNSKAYGKSTPEYIANCKDPQNLGLISISFGFPSRGSTLNSTIATPCQSSALSNVVA